MQVLPDELAHRDPESRDEHVQWVTDEMEWWARWVQTDSRRPYRPDRGLRGRSRERNLFRHARAGAGAEPTVIEMGAGSSRTMAGLWPQSGAGAPRYVATDLSREWLRSGEGLRGDGAAAVQCDAGSWPFREASADVVAILGVLHHLPDWRLAVARACESVRPGGHVLLHEVIAKPRVLESRRAGGVCDSWTSPHEGTISGPELRAELERHGRVLRWRGESTPLRFALVHYGNLHERLEHSRALTAALDLVDQAFGRTLGRLAPSLGFAEVTCVLERA